jgi:hypothetical protein
MAIQPPMKEISATLLRHGDDESNRRSRPSAEDVRMTGASGLMHIHDWWSIGGGISCVTTKTGGMNREIVARSLGGTVSTRDSPLNCEVRIDARWDVRLAISTTCRFVTSIPDASKTAGALRDGMVSHPRDLLDGRVEKGERDVLF